MSFPGNWSSESCKVAQSSQRQTSHRIGSKDDQSAPYVKNRREHHECNETYTDTLSTLQCLSPPILFPTEQTGVNLLSLTDVQHSLAHSSVSFERTHKMYVPMHCLTLRSRRSSRAPWDPPAHQCCLATLLVAACILLASAALAASHCTASAAA